jgi:peptide/nickel transport system ATP-binding protein
MRLLDPPATIEGKILYGGKDILSIPEPEFRKIRGKEIAMIFQDPMTYLNPVRRIGDQISESIIEHKGLRKHEAKKEAINVLDSVLIPEAAKLYDYYPHQLSGGMRQRVLIAIAISCNPAMLIADEPTTALDVTTQAQILNLLGHLLKQSEKTLFLITHDLGIVAEFCDRVAIMYAGKIVEDSDVLNIYKRPKHPYTQGLLKSTLSIDEFKETLFGIPGTVPNMINPPSGCRFHPRCPHAMEICKEQEPRICRIEESADKSHYVACHLYGT